MAVIFRYPSVVKPAPRFGGSALGEELRRLLLQPEQDLFELCFIVEGESGSYPRRCLITSKCNVRSDGIIILTAHLANRRRCPQTEERYYFSPEGATVPHNSKRITAMVVGYPCYEVLTVVENTDLAVRVILMPDGTRKTEAMEVAKAS